MSILINVLLVIEVLSALLIILLVLMQRPKNEGLGAAFGGGMTENLFGAQTTNVLQSFTRNLGIFFFALTALLSWLYVRQGVTKSDIQKQLAAQPVPVATPAPVGPGTTPNSIIPLELPKDGTPQPADPNATPAVPAPGAPVPGASPTPTGEKPADTPVPTTPQPPPAAPAAGESNPAAPGTNPVPPAGPSPVPATPSTPPAGQANPPAAPAAPGSSPVPAAPENKPADKPAENKPANPTPDAPKPPPQ